MFAAGTKNFCNCIEIKIRDNGAGISPEVKEKMTCARIGISLKVPARAE